MKELVKFVLLSLQEILAGTYYEDIDEDLDVPVVLRQLAVNYAEKMGFEIASQPAAKQTIDSLRTLIYLFDEETSEFEDDDDYRYVREVGGDIDSEITKILRLFDPPAPAKVDPDLQMELDLLAQANEAQQAATGSSVLTQDQLALQAEFEVQAEAVQRQQGEDWIRQMNEDPDGVYPF